MATQGMQVRLGLYHTDQIQDPAVRAEFDNIVSCLQLLLNGRPDGYVANVGSAGLVPKTTGSADDVFLGDGTYGKVAEAALSITDNTTGDVSTSAHGFVPKATGSTVFFLNANGAYSYPDSPNVKRTLTNRLMLGML